MSTLISYEEQIYLDMYHNDALVILAQGLGIERIFLNFIKLYSDPSHLVIIINTHESEEEYFIKKLKESDKLTDADMLPTKITTETHTAAERTQAYLRGGCYFVTSRILVVDMLTDKIPTDLISGILVYNAHKVIDSCQETFILRMYRQKNKKGFVKAFSDNPVYFSRSSSKVERIMRNLFVTKLYIYPRFHVDIEAELSKYKPEVIEIGVTLSENSMRIQMSLIDIINVLLQELKSCCSYIDHDFLTMEMVISKPFDGIVKGQLEPVWNHLGTKPKQLLSDIKTLRLLLYYLTQYDCITFYKMLSCLRSHEKELGRSSGWMFLDAANELFTKAKLRVYGTNMKNITKTDMSNRHLYSKHNKEMSKRIIEESPKLKVLKEALEELAHEENETEETNILIIGNDDRTCSQIKHFLRNNKLTRKFGEKQIGSDKKQQENYDVLNELKNDSKENDEFIVKMILKPIHQNDDHDTEKSDSKITKMIKGSKKFVKDKDTVTLTQMTRRNAKKAEANSKEQDEKEEEDNSSSSSSSSSEDDESTNKKPETNQDTNQKSKKFKNTNLFLSALAGGPTQRTSLVKLLFDTKPKYVILYDSALWFVRELELYKTIHFQKDMRIYFLMYKNSCEEQRYLTSIRTEKESFEILIREKAAMIIQEEQDGKKDLPLVNSIQERESIRAQAMNSRKGGDGLPKTPNTDEMPKIIVDMREFRSELPSLLHKRGFQIEPCTLEVGDYVLTPNICVERKSINDLIESLANGRLYNQANSMSRSYKTPILLIEFDQNKPFLLNSYQQLASNDINIQHTSSKLVLLTMHFPKLRVLWCSSPSEAAEIFEELKSGSPQPDAQAAMAIKTDQVIEDDNLKFNPILIDILLKIPGINSKNVQRLTSKTKNLAELFELSEEELSTILENSKAAKIAYEFINKSIREALLNEELDFEDLNDFNNEDGETIKTDNKQNEKSSKTKKEIVKNTTTKAKKRRTNAKK